MDSPSHAEQAAGFLARHREPGAFVLPNAWDAGSAKVMVQAGFRALATTSAGIAFSLGRADDGSVGRDAMLERVAQIVAAVSVPVTADLESGYGPRPSDVHATVTRAIAVGVVGANIEDSDAERGGALFAVEVAAERLAAARSAADEAGIAFTLNARIDSFLSGETDPLASALMRASAYLAAGADCIFVPGASDAETIAALVAGIDGPLNVVMGRSGTPLTTAALSELGVRRITVGGTLARATLGLVRRASEEMASGHFDFATEATPHDDLNALFAD